MSIYCAKPEPNPITVRFAKSDIFNMHLLLKDINQVTEMNIEYEFTGMSIYSPSELFGCRSPFPYFDVRAVIIVGTPCHFRPIFIYYYYLYLTTFVHHKLMSIGRSAEKFGKLSSVMLSATISIPISSEVKLDETSISISAEPCSCCSS